MRQMSYVGSSGQKWLYERLYSYLCVAKQPIQMMTILKLHSYSNIIHEVLKYCANKVFVPNKKTGNVSLEKLYCTNRVKYSR